MGRAVVSVIVMFYGVFIGVYRESICTQGKQVVWVTGDLIFFLSPKFWPT